MWRHHGELGKIIAMNRKIREIGARMKTGLLKNWRYVSLVVAAFVLLTLTWVLSRAGQSMGVVFLGFGLSVAAFLSAYWYGFPPKAGCRDSKKFFSLLAANVILFALFGFFVTRGQAAEVVFLGLLAVVISYSVWTYTLPDSSWKNLTGEIFRTILVLLALLGIAVTLEGVGEFAGLDVLGAMGQDLYELFGGS